MTVESEGDDLLVLHEVVQRVSLRDMNPTLFRQLMVLSIGSTALAFNFFFYNPTFNPGGVHKDIVGAVFVVFGVYELVLLNLRHNLRRLRLVEALSMSLLGVWGVCNMQQWDFGHGKASLQLPIVFGMLAALRFILLHAPIVNPLTANGNGKKRNGKL